VRTVSLLRYKLSLRFQEIKELESKGSMPKSPYAEKVQELHNFALHFRHNLPDFYRAVNPDTRWDTECDFVPINRQVLCYLIESFFITLHRPYMFTREASQRQVYSSALAILDSQEQMFEAALKSEAELYYMGLTFPTFESAVLLSVVLVANPERYHNGFHLPYDSLQKALKRLLFAGAKLPVAAVGSEILQTALSRVLQAQEHAGFNLDYASGKVDNIKPLQVHAVDEPHSTEAEDSNNTTIALDLEPWRFEYNLAAMDWTSQHLEFNEFDFCNLEAPMPFKELLLDDEITLDQAAPELYVSQEWMVPPDPDFTPEPGIEPLRNPVGYNPLWNFLAGYQNENPKSNHLAP
jgi:hypothetical protein